MKLERVDCYGMEMWIVTGEPLPPPQRGTHCWDVDVDMPDEAWCNPRRECVAAQWSRGES